ncbi:ABC transporter substrate-binding protein [Promicromonospora sp. NPDC057488]|uniref:ABC transporter substrate-binding protein n=1 Tax=Promicromonospora sp. NPDC057488 TaxID=3346147 RepID=UPI0036705AC1
MGHARSFGRRVSALVVSLVLLTSACAGGSPSGDGTAGGRDDTMIYGKTDGGTTFVHNYNVVGPAVDKAPNMELVYEPLMRIDYSNGAVVEPWLAESWEFDDAGTTLTVHLRDGVTFSDGEPFTADDAVFSLNLPIEQPEFSIAGVTYEKAEKVDDLTLTVTFAAPSFATVKQFANILLPMVPEHVWRDQDLNTWTNPEPVGTGPFTLAEFKPQQVTLTARDDYWGGELPMSTYKIIPTSADAAKAQLLRGDIDIAQGSWANGEQEYTAKDPEHNLYQLYPNGGAMSAMFNAGRPPFDDVHVRRALAMTVDRTAITTTLQRPDTESGPTGLNATVYADWINPELADPWPVDVEAAKAELADGGWTVQDGALVKDGESYKPTILFNNDWAWGSYADIMINGWRDSLGIEVEPAGQPTAGYYDAMNLGDFDITAASTGGAGVYGVYGFLDSDFVVPVGESATLNQGRWSNAEADEIIAAMESTDDEAELKELGLRMQDLVVDEVPFSPLYDNFYFVEINAKRWSGWPTPDNFDHIPFVGMGPDLILTMLDLEPAED